MPHAYVWHEGEFASAADRDVVIILCIIIEGLLVVITVILNIGCLRAVKRYQKFPDEEGQAMELYGHKGEGSKPDPYTSTIPLA